MHFRITHEFDATPEEFWEVFFDEPFNVEQYKRIKVKERTMLSRKEDDKGIAFSVRILPERDLPSVVKKIVKGDLGYVESTVYTRATSSMEIDIVPTLFADRTKIHANFKVEPLPGGRCRRTFEGDLTVKFAIFGGAIERAIYDDMAKSYDVAAAVHGEWMARLKAERAKAGGAAGPGGKG